MKNQSPNFFNDIGVSDDGQYICNGHQPILCVRGWGYLTGVLKLDAKEAIRIQNDFVKWAAEMLSGYGENKLTIAEYKIKNLTEKNEVMSSILKYIEDNYGGTDRKISSSLGEVINLEGDDYVRPVGWIDNCVMYKKFEDSVNKHIRFYADGSEHSAEWYPGENYAVCQWSEYEDTYHGYILLPNMWDIEQGKDIIRCYCFYYDC